MFFVQSYRTNALKYTEHVNFLLQKNLKVFLKREKGAIILLGNFKGNAKFLVTKFLC